MEPLDHTHEKGNPMRNTICATLTAITLTLCTALADMCREMRYALTKRTTKHWRRRAPNFRSIALLGISLIFTN